jgi:hypothetical protein
VQAAGFGEENPRDRKGDTDFMTSDARWLDLLAISVGTNRRHVGANMPAASC